jgi:hypothetical protein
MSLLELSPLVDGQEQKLAKIPERRKDKDSEIKIEKIKPEQFISTFNLGSS